MRHASIAALLLFACCSSDESAADMAALGHYAQCTNGIGLQLGDCASGLVCTPVYACVGLRLDPPSDCLMPGEH